ncbi:MAG: GGDEF domain-containing protein [Paucibacter sp.]|nr:GGDEF domain-containing protein [Roseateles sp.]
MESTASASFASHAVSVLSLIRRHLGKFGTLIVLALKRLQGQAGSRKASAGQLDVLTGLLARDAFLCFLARECALARRHGIELSVLRIDVDHLRAVNHRYGKRCGNELLRRVGTRCTRTLRGGDVVARFDGGEFMVLLPHTDALGALDTADRLRERVAALDFGWFGHAVQVNVSVGVASLREDLGLADQLLHEADQALRQAKAAGRNCVRALGGPEPASTSHVR